MEGVILKDDNLVGVRAIYSNGEVVYEDRKGKTDTKNDAGGKKNQK